MQDELPTLVTGPGFQRLLNLGKGKSVGDHLFEQRLCSTDGSYHGLGVPLMVPVPASVHRQPLAVDLSRIHGTSPAR